MNLKEYIKEYIDNNDIEKYNLNDIYLIISKVLNISKDKIILNLTKDNFENINQNEVKENIRLSLDKYYINHIPLQYILGKWNFYKEEYIVNEQVLVPRADSEILVEIAIKYINDFNLKHMIDMCSRIGLYRNIYIK